jgi:hypothetical protein
MDLIVFLVSTFQTLAGVIGSFLLVFGIVGVCLNVESSFIPDPDY